MVVPASLLYSPSVVQCVASAFASRDSNALTKDARDVRIAVRSAFRTSATAAGGWPCALALAPTWPRAWLSHGHAALASRSTTVDAAIIRREVRENIDLQPFVTWVCCVLNHARTSKSVRRLWIATAGQSKTPTHWPPIPRKMR